MPWSLAGSLGEPLQYVLGHWAFRTLDLLVDRRVLIPRPETEQLVEVALSIARATTGPLTIADLGTGSGAIAMALAAELFPRPLTVWATDASDDALAVARANLAGMGRAAVAVRMEAGSWYDALPPDLAGHLDLVVSNPPYIGTAEDLDERVRDWEPAAALLAGPDGLDALREVIAGAPALAGRGRVVGLRDRRRTRRRGHRPGRGRRADRRPASSPTSPATTASSSPPRRSGRRHLGCPARKEAAADRARRDLACPPATPPRAGGQSARRPRRRAAFVASKWASRSGTKPMPRQLEADQAVAGGPDPLGDVDGIARPQRAGVDPAADGVDEHPERARGVELARRRGHELGDGPAEHDGVGRR